MAFFSRFVTHVTSGAGVDPLRPKPSVDTCATVGAHLLLAQNRGIATRAEHDDENI
jgi:hypothetical protein